MFGLLYGPRLTTTSSSASLSELDKVSALKESMDGLDALMNDNLIGKANHHYCLLIRRRGTDIGEWIKRIP